MFIRSTVLRYAGDIVNTVCALFTDSIAEFTEFSEKNPQVYGNKKEPLALFYARRFTRLMLGYLNPEERNFNLPRVYCGFAFPVD